MPLGGLAPCLRRHVCGAYLGAWRGIDLLLQGSSGSLWECDAILGLNHQAPSPMSGKLRICAGMHKSIAAISHHNGVTINWATTGAIQKIAQPAPENTRPKP
jgi:hypothetical protein